MITLTINYDSEVEASLFPFQMNKKALIVLLLVSMLMVAEMDAWFIRFRRIRIRLRRILGDACKKTCPRVCPKILGEACKFGCGKLCGRKKRMVSQLPALVYLSLTSSYMGQITLALNNSISWR